MRDDRYQLGILIAENRMWADNGQVLAVGEDTIPVANPINTPLPVEGNQLHRANWAKLLRSNLKCPVFGTALLYAIWGTIKLRTRYAVPMPRIRIVNDLPAHTLGMFWFDGKKPVIDVAQTRIYTYASLASVIAHEFAHQVQRTVFKSDGPSHDPLFKKIADDVSRKTGIPIHLTTDLVRDQTFQPVEKVVKSKWPIYYVVVPSTPAAVTYSDSYKETEEILLALDPDMDVSVYKSYDAGPIDWLKPETELTKFARVRPDVVKAIARGHKIYP